jgi:hypothetical protein
MALVWGRMAHLAEEFPVELRRSGTRQASRCGAQAEPGDLLSQQYSGCTVAGDYGRPDAYILLRDRKQRRQI